MQQNNFGSYKFEFLTEKNGCCGKERLVKDETEYEAGGSDKVETLHAMEGALVGQFQICFHPWFGSWIIDPNNQQPKDGKTGDI